MSRTYAVRRAAVVVAVAVFARSLFAQGPAAGGDGLRFFDQGRAAFDAGRAGAAADLFEKAVKAEPRNTTYLLWLGRAYGTEAQKANPLRQPGLARKTRDAWERAAEIDPNDLDVRASLITYYLQAPGILGGSVDKARAQANEVQRRNALRGLMLHADIYAHEKKYADAERMLQQAMREKSERPMAAYALGTLYVNTGAFDKAFAVYESVWKERPSEKIALYQIGRVGAMSGQQLDRAQSALEQYLTTTPGKDEPALAAARWRLGQIFERRGDRARARAEYEASLRLDPSFKQASDALKKLG